MRFHFVANIGAFTAINGAFVPTRSTLACMTGVYDLAAVYARVELAVTNTAPTAAYRGAGRPVMSYILERLVDEAAVALNMGAAELRRLNLVPKERFPYTTAHGAVYDSGEFEVVLDKALKAADWSGFEQRRAASAARGRLRGRGIAHVHRGHGRGLCTQGRSDHEVRRRRQNHRLCRRAITGPGPRNDIRPGHCRTLGIPVEHVLLRSGEAGIRLVGNSAGGSRSMLGIGSTCRITSLTVIEKGMALAADALEAPAADIEFKDGDYRIKGTDRSITMLELMRRHAGTSPHPLDTSGEGKFGRHLSEQLPYRRSRDRS